MRLNHNDPSLSPQTVLWLQTICGNRAVQRVLARKVMDHQRQSRAAVEVRNHRTWLQRLIQLFRK